MRVSDAVRIIFLVVIKRCSSLNPRIGIRQVDKYRIRTVSYPIRDSRKNLCFFMPFGIFKFQVALQNVPVCSNYFGFFGQFMNREKRASCRRD